MLRDATPEMKTETGNFLVLPWDYMLVQPTFVVNISLSMSFRVLFAFSSSLQPNAIHPTMKQWIWPRMTQQQLQFRQKASTSE